MNCVILHPKETTRNSSLSGLFSASSGQRVLPTVEELKPILRRSTCPEYIGAWKWSTLQIHLFGFKSGKAGTENKHELPPPFDTTVLYGEAIAIATKNDALVNFTTNEYTKFYNETSGGIEEGDGEGEDFDEDGDGEGEDEAEEEAEGEEEVEEEVEEEASDKEEVAYEDEEPIPLAVVKVPAKPKRGNRKLPIWFTYPELEPESYSL